MSIQSSQTSPLPGKPLLIQMSGAPGSGKTTTSQALRRHLSATILDHDILRSTVLNSDIPFLDAAKLSYNLGFALADALLKQGHTVILDSPCNYEETIAQGRAVAEGNGVAYWYVEVRVGDLEVLDGRLKGRVPLRSQRTGVRELPVDAGGVQEEGDAGKLFERWIKRPARPEGNVVFVDGLGDVEGNRDYILERILEVDA